MHPGLKIVRVTADDCIECCRIGKFCDRPESEIASRGVGDTIAKITTAVGIKPCGGCKKRQQKLNDLFRYKN